jgi:N-acetylmuramoyl-L-alanine amidase
MLKNAIIFIIALFCILTTTANSAYDIGVPRIMNVVLEDVQDPVQAAEIDCLAKNIYFEARGEPESGQKAVAYVTVNRTKSGLYPNKVCNVVHQARNGHCEFSWVCHKPKAVSDWHAWEQAVGIATVVLATYNPAADPSHDALFYHVKKIHKPIAKGKFKCTAQIGNHKFYKKVVNVENKKRKDHTRVLHRN